MILIIDNLDRIPPDIALNFVVSLNIYLRNVDNIMTILIFDQYPIENKLRMKYGVTSPTSYLAKFIDHYWGMPLPRNDGYRETIEVLLKSSPKDCFHGLDVYINVFGAMLKKAGIVNLRLIEMILKRFVSNLYVNCDNSFNLKNSDFDTLTRKRKPTRKDHRIIVIYHFYVVLMFMKWPWLYNGFYHYGVTGSDFTENVYKKLNSMNWSGDNNILIDVIQNELAPFLREHNIKNEPGLVSFLSSYFNLTCWANPGSALIKSIQGKDGLPLDKFTESINELIEGAKVFDDRERSLVKAHRIV